MQAPINFTIVTAVTAEYLELLWWAISSWCYKPQFRDKPLIVYYNGIKEKDLSFVYKIYKNAKLIPWDMVGIENVREKMFSSFIFGAARDVQTPYYVKLDADTCFTTDSDVFTEDDLKYDLVAHRWGYTKPGWYTDVLDNYYNGTNNPIDKTKEKSFQKRLQSFCCLHRTDWVKGLIPKFNSRLPVPSHDTTLSYYAEKEGKWLGKNMHELGVLHTGKWKDMRENICSGDAAFNPLLNDTLMSHTQLEITSRCNIGCNQCDRNCGAVAPAKDMELSQVWKFIEESLEAKKEWKRIDIIGGEPTLHPKLTQIFELIKVYKNLYPHTKIRFSTNGLGEKVAEGIAKVPDWIGIRNSGKQSKEQPHDAYRCAPIDLGAKEIKSCSIPWRCGIGLTVNGYFPCGAGASLARVYGFDIGIKQLKDVNPDSIKKQMIQLCKYCGHSNCETKKMAVGNEMTESWKRAIENHKPEKMSIY